MAINGRFQQSHIDEDQNNIPFNIFISEAFAGALAQFNSSVILHV
jgi:hypothetical protein